MSFHQHAQMYRPPQIFNTAPRRPWLWRLLILVVLAIILALASVGVAAVGQQVSQIHAQWQSAHDQGVDDGLRTCGMVR